LIAVSDPDSGKILPHCTHDCAVHRSRRVRALAHECSLTGSGCRAGFPQRRAHAAIIAAPNDLGSDAARQLVRPGRHSQPNASWHEILPEPRSHGAPRRWSSAPTREKLDLINSLRGQTYVRWRTESVALSA
jgi:hypothetical protein